MLRIEMLEATVDEEGWIALALDSKRVRDGDLLELKEEPQPGQGAVSYTHLTLPTIYSV